jgi:saccharopine dehydrogenase-like NADP-dependent oxidoreductase
VGLGASPGVSNLLAVKAIGLLDKVHTVITGWGFAAVEESGGMPGPGEGGTYGAAYDHWLHQLTGEIRLWRDGKYADVRPLQAVEVDYPGIGRGVTYTVGHPEPVTLPRCFPQIRESCNVMNFPASTIAILRWLAKRVEDGELSFTEGTDWLISLEQGGDQERLLADVPPELIQGLIPGGAAREPLLPSLFAVAVGSRDGQPASAAATVSSAPSGSMGAITAIPLFIGLKMIAEEKIERSGVFAPEAVIDPDAFFDALAPFCEPKRTNHEDMLIITTAP